MGDDGAAAAANAAVGQYPAPPHFYALYRAGPSAGPPPPPPPPESAEFAVFGAPFRLGEPLVPPLEVGALFTPRADGSVDAKAELLKLHAALLALFLELLGVLADAPGAYAEALTRVIGALQNMQHLINGLRPVQARHTLEAVLKQQIAAKRAALAGLREAVAAARSELLTAAGALAGAAGTAAAAGAGAGDGTAAAAAAAAMDAS